MKNPIQDLKKDLQNADKPSLIEEYMQEYTALTLEQSRIKNTKDKKFLALSRKIKDVQAKLFLLRASQINESRPS